MKKINNAINNELSKTPHTYTGKLIYDQNALYILYSPITKSTINISDILYNICYSSNNRVKIRILKGCKILFDESGRLVNEINVNNGLLNYYVNSEDLESIIFNNCDEYVDIEIYSEFLDDMGRKQGDMITYGTK